MERKNYLITTKTGRYIVALNEFEVNAINEALDIWIEIQEEKFIKAYEIHYINEINEVTEEKMLLFNIDLGYGLTSESTVIFDGVASEGIDSDELAEIIVNSDYVYYYQGNVNITFENAKLSYKANKEKLFDLAYIAQNGDMISKINLSMLDLTKELYRLKNENLCRYGYISIFDTVDRKVLKEVK